MVGQVGTGGERSGGAGVGEVAEEEGKGTVTWFSALGALEDNCAVGGG